MATKKVGQLNHLTLPGRQAGIKPFNHVFILSDAFHIKYLKGIGLKNQKAIKCGDRKSISIAAASILAKVYRDNLMKKLSRKNPVYGWGKNKGYGTSLHQKAILRYGLTRLHRKAFIKTFLEKLLHPEVSREFHTRCGSERVLFL